MKKITSMVPVKEYVCDICGEKYDYKQEAVLCECVHLIMKYIKTLQVGHIYYFPWLERKFIPIKNLEIGERDFKLITVSSETVSDIIIDRDIFRKTTAYNCWNIDIVEERIGQIRELTLIEALDMGMKISTDMLLNNEEIVEQYKQWLLTKSPLYLINRFYAGGELTGLTAEDITNTLLA